MRDNASAIIAHGEGNAVGSACRQKRRTTKKFEMSNFENMLTYAPTMSLFRRRARRPLSRQRHKITKASCLSILQWPSATETNINLSSGCNGDEGRKGAKVRLIARLSWASGSFSVEG
jgi:hypothetical protein